MACERFIDEVTVEGLKPRTVAEYERQLAWWGKERGLAKLNLSQIKREHINDGVYFQAKHNSKLTANRYLAPIRAMLKRAHEQWGWLQFPVTGIKQFDESYAARKRSLTPDEISRVLSFISVEKRDATMFSLVAGLRSANVLELRWDWVDLVNRIVTIPREFYKNGAELTIPLNETAYEIVRRQIGKSDKYVFINPKATNKDKKFSHSSLSSESWRRALTKAGIADYRWHDNRHTWATQLRKSGVGLEDIQDLGGWKDEKMVRRYAAADLDTLSLKSKALDAVWSTIGHTGLESGKKEADKPHLRLVG